MELKFNQTESVHTVQIEGKDVQVVPVETVNKFVETANQEVITTVENAQKEERTKVSRELSKKIGVNLFDETETNNFLERQKTMVSKEDFDAVKSELGDFLTLKTEHNNLQIDHALLKGNVAEDYQPKAKKLIDLELKTTEGITLDQAAAKVLKEFPMFVSKTKRVGIDLNDDPETMTGYERHVAEKYKDNPYYKK